MLFLLVCSYVMFFHISYPQSSGISFHLPSTKWVIIQYILPAAKWDILLSSLSLSQSIGRFFYIDVVSLDETQCSALIELAWANFNDHHWVAYCILVYWRSDELQRSDELWSFDKLRQCDVSEAEKEKDKALRRFHDTSKTIIHKIEYASIYW